MLSLRILYELANGWRRNGKTSAAFGAISRYSGQFAHVKTESQGVRQTVERLAAGWRCLGLAMSRRFFISLEMGSEHVSENMS
jgi:hypothetical protein